MMNKMRSARMHLTRFFFLLPLLTVLLLAFRSRQVDGEHVGVMLLNTTFTDQASPHVSDTIVPPVRGEWNPQPTESQKDFIRRHPAVERIAWGYMTDVKIAGTGNAQTTNPRSGFNEGDLFMTDATIADADGTDNKKLRSAFRQGDMFMIIYFKNGKWDMYNVNNEESVSKFKKNYGELPPKAPAPPRSSAVHAGKKEIAPTASRPANPVRSGKSAGFSYLAADSLIWSSDKNTLTLMGNAMVMDEATETIMKSDAIVLRQAKLEKVFVDGNSLAPDDLHLNPPGYALRMQTLTAGEATRRYGIDFAGTVLEITTEKVETKR